VRYVKTELRGAGDSHADADYTDMHSADADYTDMHSADSSMATAGRDYLTHALDKFLRSAKTDDALHAHPSLKSAEI
jgi:hypothetical protein